MTREINGRIRMVVSDDGTRCAAECPGLPKTRDPACWPCQPYGHGRSVFIGYAPKRHPECIAAEQAAASMPSCEAWTPALRDRVRVTGCDIVGTGTIVAIGTEGSALGMHRVRFDDTGVVVSRIPRDRLVRLVEVPASAQSGHLDGGARALDASEALREARVQGMEEARECVVEVARETPFGNAYADLDDAKEAIDAAIEAVRKGER